MAYGDILEVFGEGPAKVGTLIDIYQGFNQADDAAQARANELALQSYLVQQEQARIAQREADMRALRDRALQRGAELDGALKEAYAKLGARIGVSPEDVNQNYVSNMNRFMGEYNKTVGTVASQGFADAISRGMDNSTQFTDQQAEIARKAATEIPALQQAAFDAAINQSRNYADTLNYGRDATLDEVGTVYGTAADFDRDIYNQNSSGASYNNLLTDQRAIANNATDYAAGAQDYLGDAVGRLKENFNFSSAGSGNRKSRVTGSSYDPELEARLYG
jgi:hypothetical protein